jgi:hypothetical protein
LIGAKLNYIISLQSLNEIAVQQSYCGRHNNLHESALQAQQTAIRKILLCIITFINMLRNRVYVSACAVIYTQITFQLDVYDENEYE